MNSVDFANTANISRNELLRHKRNVAKELAQSIVLTDNVKSEIRDDFSKKRDSRLVDNKKRVANIPHYRTRSEERMGGMHGRHIVGNAGSNKGKHRIWNFCKATMYTNRQWLLFAKKSINDYEDRM
jgi:hypothetical protein